LMQNVLGPFLPGTRLRLGDVALILQQSVQRATGKSFEIMMGKGDMVMASHQMSESSRCRLRVGEYYTTVNETPVQYDITNAALEEELSNIDFGEPLGGSGYPGQRAFPRLDRINSNQARSFIPFKIYVNNVRVEDLIVIFQPPYVRPLECFSGDLIVETTEGPKRMSELKTGDVVMSVDESLVSFSPIIMFLHRDEELRAEFNVITTANGKSVKLTNEHLIYVSDCNPNSVLKLVRYA
ncbi:hypothetical protein PENTCL1PPCAC_3569, partial [Pristionchus entomophagus]